RRGGEAPHRQFGPGIRQDVARPDFLARAGVEAVELAGRPHRVDLAVAERRRGPRAGTGHYLAEARLVGMLPQFGARVRLIADHDLVVAALLLCVEPVADYRERGPARSDAMPPEQLRRVLLPIGEDADAGTAAVAVGTAKARPIARTQFVVGRGICAALQLAG